ncbi:hypothetical protein M6B38_240300 [Iris pallida]|uniref:Uncharacterized protein n=1 Tax=Iris pallida TaxID=29817 RepID=A0AAX6DKD5_IRIPA|nr:hypothetical protein M6B38_240300 [Iris pallida]
MNVSIEKWCVPSTRCQFIFLSLHHLYKTCLVTTHSLIQAFGPKEILSSLFRPVSTVVLLPEEEFYCILGDKVVTKP